MLRHCKVLFERRQHQKNRRSVHFPRIKLRKWLFIGNEEERTLPPSKKEPFQPAESPHLDQKPSRNLRKRTGRKPTHFVKALWYKARKACGRFLDWAGDSDALLYASKFTFGVMLLSFPAYMESWTEWYSASRGGEQAPAKEPCYTVAKARIVWAPLICVLVFENAVGSSIWIFALRAVGTVVGSSWGFAAFRARNGNPFVVAVMLMLGTIPGFYFQLGTRFQKAAMVGSISMCVVCLSTLVQTVPGRLVLNL